MAPSEREEEEAEEEVAKEEVAEEEEAAEGSTGESSDGEELDEGNDDEEPDEEEQRCPVSSDEEQQHDGAGGEQQTPRRSRKPRPPTKWPKDKMMVTEIDEGGMPTERKQKLRLRRLCGLIASQKLSLVMLRFNCLSRQQKWSLFDKYIMPWLHFPAEMKDSAFKKVMKTTAKSWRTHRSNLYRKYILKGLTPFKKHPYLEPEDWDEFVEFKRSEEAQAESERFKRLRDLNVHNHNLGPIGYDGKQEQWEREDSELTYQGIPNPWDEYPPGRPRNWLRGRSELLVSEGTA
ncbi:unnamed protein product [Urochloa humidicola]